MNIRRSITATILALACLTGSALAQDKMKMKDKDKAKATKSYTFHGKVEAITDKGLTVNGEKVEGWMEAMKMTYPVDKPEVLKMVKVGDNIMATVYDNDMTLHNVMTMPAEKSGQQKSK